MKQIYCFYKLLLFPLGVSCTVELRHFSFNFFISGDFIIWAVLMTLSPVLPTEASWGTFRYTPLHYLFLNLPRSRLWHSHLKLLCFALSDSYQRLLFHHIWPTSLKLVACYIFLLFSIPDLFHFLTFQNVNFAVQTIGGVDIWCKSRVPFHHICVRSFLLASDFFHSNTTSLQAAHPLLACMPKTIINLKPTFYK